MTNAEIQVGEYYRAKDGYIGKIDRAEGYDFTSIKSHSFNIIDLIELGDYVNGTMVDETTDGTLGIVIVDQFIPINEVQIRSVVTIEQFRKVEVDIK